MRALRAVEEGNEALNAQSVDAFLNNIHYVVNFTNEQQVGHVIPLLHMTVTALIGIVDPAPLAGGATPKDVAGCRTGS